MREFVLQAQGVLLAPFLTAIKIKAHPEISRPRLRSGDVGHRVVANAGWFRHNGQYEVVQQVRSWGTTGVVLVSRGVLHPESVP